MNNFILYLDDTGFNAHEKYSKALKNECGTYVGIIVPVEQVEGLQKIISGLGEILKNKYDVSEFHFTDIYNGAGKFKEMPAEEKLELLDAFADFVNMFNIKAFIHTSNNNEKSQDEKNLDTLLSAVLKVINLQDNAKTKAMLKAYFKAKKFVVENFEDGRIEKAVADSGFRKDGVAVGVDKAGFKIEFKDSNNEPLLQLADFAAWYITRAKNLFDKATKKGMLSDFDIQVLNIYSKLSDTYVGVKQYEIDYSKLSEFDYDKIISE